MKKSDLYNPRIQISPVQVGQQWRHLKRGGIYEILSIATGQGGDIEDKDVVVYVRVNGSQMETGAVWARRMDEFLDGRFELVPKST